MRYGAIVGEVNPAVVTQEDVLRLAMFGAEGEGLNAPIAGAHEPGEAQR